MAEKKMKKLIVGNWKMNPESVKDAVAIFLKIKKVAGALRRVETVVCPPSLFLGDLQKKGTGHRCALGGQDCHFEPAGSYTGEISPLQLASMKVNYVIIGHSERRAMGETDEMVAKKIKAALSCGLSVILCVGEDRRDPSGKYLHRIEKQLLDDLKFVARPELDRVIVAYEPLWAIGKEAKRPAKSADVFEMKIFTKRVLSDKFGKDNANRIRFLYGGSVDEKNAGVFLSEGEADGLLVGRASVDAKVFEKILKIAET